MFQSIKASLQKRYSYAAWQIYAMALAIVAFEQIGVFATYGSVPTPFILIQLLGLALVIIRIGVQNSNQ